MAAYNIEVLRYAGRPTRYEETLLAYTLDIANWVQNYMLANDRIATGDSISSMKILVHKNEIIFEAAPSVAYALQGRGPGKFPDVAEIEKWIQAKPVEAYPDSKGRIPTLQQLTFLISRKISEEGTDPPKLLPQNIQFTVVQLGSKYYERLGAEMADEVREQFVEQFKRNQAYKNK